MNLLITSEEAMQRFGYKLAEHLTPGSVIALTGDLGAGKTTLSQSIAKGLGVVEDVTSPTFALMNVYETERGIPVYHFDVYRILELSEMEEIGFEEFVYGEGISLIEWAGIIEPLVPENALWIEIGYGLSPGERHLRLSSPSHEIRQRIKTLIASTAYSEDGTIRIEEDTAL